MIIEYSSDSSEYSDTLTQDDMVRNQYLSLPYPAVTKHNIHVEQQYYNNHYKRDTPFNIATAYTLERINHFLFQGRNNFR